MKAPSNNATHGARKSTTARIRHHGTTPVPTAPLNIAQRTTLAPSSAPMRVDLTGAPLFEPVPELPWSPLFYMFEGLDAEGTSLADGCPPFAEWCGAAHPAGAALEPPLRSSSSVTAAYDLPEAHMGFFAGGGHGAAASASAQSSNGAMDLTYPLLADGYYPSLPFQPLGKDSPEERLRPSEQQQQQLKPQQPRALLPLPAPQLTTQGHHHFPHHHGLSEQAHSEAHVEPSWEWADLPTHVDWASIGGDCRAVRDEAAAAALAALPAAAAPARRASEERHPPPFRCSREPWTWSLRAGSALVPKAVTDAQHSSTLDGQT